MLTWASQTLQGLLAFFSWAESHHSWYVFFTLFSTYTLIPLPLVWSIAAGATTSTLHLLVDVCCRYSDHIVIRKVWFLSILCVLISCLSFIICCPFFLVGCTCQVLSKTLLYLAMNTAGLFIHYLSDRTQRQSFLETRRCIEGRVRLERENQRQVESKPHPRTKGPHARQL